MTTEPNETLVFANGYGISAIPTRYPDIIEIAVLHDEQLCYRTPLTSDVLRIPWHELPDIVQQVRDLPPLNGCPHKTVPY